MNLEEFNNLAAGIQSLMLALAVLVGGGWSLFQFKSLKSIEKAKREIEIIKRELQKRSIVQVQMDANEFKAHDDQGRYICITISLTNVGNHTEIINWSESKIVAALTTCEEDGSLVFGPEIKAQYTSLYTLLKASTIDPGNTEKYAFLVPIETPGVYTLDAMISGSELETELSTTATNLAGTGDPHDVTYWGVNMLLNVTD